MVAVFSALVAALFLYPAIVELPRLISRNFNEGWNALHAVRFANGLPLYPSTDALVVNNYPPLWYLLLGVPQALDVDVVIFGRICALVSQLVCCFLVAQIALALTDHKFASYSAGLFFLAGTAAWLPTYVAMNDPQWLALAIMLWGLLKLLNAQSSWQIAAAGVVIVLGGFVKHSGLAITLAAAGYLSVTNWQYARVFGVSALSAAATGLVICTLVFGDDFLTSLFLHSRETDIRLPFWLFLKNPFFFVLGATVFVVTVSAWRKSSSHKFASILLLISFGSGLVFTIGVGIAENVFLEAWVALAIAFSLIGSTLGLSGSNAFLRDGLVALGMALLLIMTARTHWSMALPSLHTLSARELATSDAIATARNSPGRVACETSAICYWAGKPTELDFFNIGQQLRLGDVSIRHVLESLDERQVLLFQFSSGSPEIGSTRFSDEFNQALRSRFAMRQQPASTLGYRFADRIHNLSIVPGGE